MQKPNHNPLLVRDIWLYQAVNFFVIAIAASEVAVGLGLLIVWFKRHGTIDLDSMSSMRG